MRAPVPFLPRRGATLGQAVACIELAEAIYTQWLAYHRDGAPSWAQAQIDASGPWHDLPKSDVGWWVSRAEQVLKAIGRPEVHTPDHIVIGEITAETPWGVTR
jgi:hypothetical protein